MMMIITHWCAYLLNKFCRFFFDVDELYGYCNIINRFRVHVLLITEKKKTTATMKMEKKAKI